MRVRLLLSYSHEGTDHYKLLPMFGVLGLEQSTVLPIVSIIPATGNLMLRKEPRLIVYSGKNTIVALLPDVKTMDGSKVIVCTWIDGGTNENAKD